MTTRPVVAYAGIAGAFAHEACSAFLPDHEPLARPDFAAAIAAVRTGTAACAMLPLDNVEAGPTGAEALIIGGGLAIHATHLLPIRMHLLGLPGARIDRLRTIASHPVALAQCRRFLATMAVEVEEASNTAVAAQGLKRLDQGALASAAAAKLYDLEILRENVHDRADNFTRFAVAGPMDRAACAA